MAYAIIDSYSVKEFLQQQGAEIIYNSVSNDITSRSCVEVWLKGSSLISLKIDPGSNLLTSVDLHSKCGLESFNFYEHKLDLFQTFCGKVQIIDATTVDSIIAADWKKLLKIFSVGEDYGTDLENANALINAFQKVYPDYVAKFDSIKCELQDLINDAFQTDSPFQPGDLLYKSGSELYRYIGEVDDCGNRLFSGGISSDCNFKDLVEFKDHQVVDAVPFFEETVKGFPDVFDANFIKAVAGIIDSNCGSVVLEDGSVDQVCVPFQELVTQKRLVEIEHRDFGGYHYSIDVAPELVVEGSFDYMLASASIHKKEGRFGSKKFIEGTLNPLFIREDNSIKSALKTVLDFLSNLYETFSYEIAELGLTDPFIDLYSLWYQLYTITESDYDYGKTIYQELYKALAPKELQQNTVAEAHTVDAFSSNSFSSSLFGRQKKTVIEANDTPLDAIFKMSEGVPGAIVVLNSLMQHPELVEPAHPFFEILALDSAGIRGSDLYTLFTYCCENSIMNHRLVSLNRAHGNLSIETIKEFIKEDKSFFRNRDAAGMENFQDWSSFDDCYPDAEDSYFDPDKGKYYTWSYSWKNATNENLVATKIVAKEDSSTRVSGEADYSNLISFLENMITDNSLTDTKNGMPWREFIGIALEQGFKDAYEGLIEDEDDLDRHECFMYREDGLILYANSFWGDLNHAVVLGEVSSASENISLLDLGSGGYGKSGSFVFSKDVRDEMVSFLNFLQESNVLLLPVWTEKRVVMDILTGNEWNSVEESDSGHDDLIMKKLSLCCEEAKRIMAPYFEEDINNDLAESKPKKPLRNIFNKLRR